MEISKENPNLNFGIAAFPQVKIGQKYPLTSATVYALAITNNSKNVAGSKISHFASSTEDLTTKLANRFNMASALRSVVSAPATGYQDLVNKQTILAKSWTDPDPVQTDQLFQGMIEDVISGADKPQEAAQRADKAISALLSTSNTRS